MSEMDSRRSYKATLCWSCDNACGGCSWSKKNAKPVEGWVAEETILRMSRTSPVKSYYVKACPQYVPDRGEREKAKCTKKQTKSDVLEAC